MGCVIMANKELINDIMAYKNAKEEYGDEWVDNFYDDEEQFIKQNDEPIQIEYVEDEHDEEFDFEPSFWWNGRRYHLADFIRCHNNPWISDYGIPDYIHAMEADNYYHPLYIELIDDDYINIYEEK